MSELLPRLFRALLVTAADLLLPPRCPACDALVDPGALFCPPCEVSLLAVEAPCPRCGEPDVGRRCQRCSPPPAFETLRAPLLYGGQLAEAIGRLKYQRRSDVATTLARLWDPMLRGSQLTEIDIVVPVPLHRRRLIERGYNQAALLARPLARRLGRPLAVSALSRVRSTRSQTNLAASARRANVAGAFDARAPIVQGQRVLLVDDVATTGETAQACALALRAAGAKTVSVLALARAAAARS